MSRPLLSLLLLLLSGPAAANGPPLQSETAFVTGLSGAAIRSFAKVAQAQRGDRVLTTVLVPVIVPYELLDNKLVIGAGLPLWGRSLAVGDARREGGFGPGDLFVFGKFRLAQVDGPGKTFRLAGKVQLAMPTGSTHLRDDLGVLPRALQRGSGRFVPTLALVMTALSRRFGINAGARYVVRPPLLGVDPGDTVGYDVAASFRLIPKEFKTWPAAQLNLMFELNGMWTSRAWSGGEEVDASGGHVLYASPGVQFIYGKVIVEAGAQIALPGVTQLHGDQLVPLWTAMGGIRWLLF